MDKTETINKTNVTTKNILFGLNFSAHSIEFLKKNTNIIHASTIKKLNLILPFSNVNLNLFITTGINPFKPIMDFNMSNAL